SHPALRRLSWHASRLLFEHHDYPAHQIRLWPTTEALLGEDAGLFYLLLALDAMPRMRATHRALGVPAEVSRAGGSHFTESSRIYRLNHEGRWGFEPRVLYWLRNHTTGQLFRLGRFDYMVRPFCAYVHVYRHAATGRTVALAADRLQFDPAGYLRGEWTAPEEVWTASFSLDDEAVTGVVISPEGRARSGLVCLKRTAWQPVLRPGDPVAEVHIPAGGQMTLEACAESLRSARVFFPRYLPDRPFRAFSCLSWIMNPELAEWYGAATNLARLQREGYLFPISSSGRDGLYFIFGQDSIDPAVAPGDTSIRRAMIARLAAGLPLRAGGWFLLPEEMPRFGSQPYLGPAAEPLPDALGG
ncbi:MAG: DUF5596 domain-containing protein, partial [Armatimonadetes bacterium]|nr:DUF5596 domain-containing protein [Armatimonadota bacterium]